MKKLMMFTAAIWMCAQSAYTQDTSGTVVPVNPLPPTQPTEEIAPVQQVQPQQPEALPAEQVTTDAPAATPETGKVLVLSEKVGEEIDIKERKKYDLFSGISKKEFQSAKFLEMADGSAIARIIKKDGASLDIPFSSEEIEALKNKINPPQAATTAAVVTEPAPEDHPEEAKKKGKRNILDMAAMGIGTGLVIVALVIFPF